MDKQEKKEEIEKEKVSKSREVKHSKLKDRRLLFFFIIILLCVFALILIFLVSQFSNFTNPVNSIISEPKLFNIRDECSLIVGKIIHTIQDEDSCIFRCKSYCNLRKMDFYEAKFFLSENDCNICKCYCK